MVGGFVVRGCDFRSEVPCANLHHFPDPRKLGGACLIPPATGLTAKEEALINIVLDLLEELEHYVLRRNAEICF